MDYYNRLGVKKDASPDELKRAYKKLAMKHHPDRGGDQKTFQEINEAYDTLKDPNKKAAYDNPQTQFNTSAFNQNYGNFNDIFSQMFSGRGFAQQRKNPDIQLNLTVELADIVNGKNMVGRYRLSNGEEVVANINVPPGIENGQLMKVNGMGDNVNPNLPRGDLYAKIIIKKHPLFERDRLHLRTSCSINVITLILGTEIELKTIDNKALKLKIPKGTNPGTILSIPGYGITDYKTQRCGNLYVEVKGVTPKLDKWEDIDKVKKLNDELNLSS